MIKNSEIIQAVSNLNQRAERQKDDEKIISSYVETGILHQLLNNNNQIIFGRRGTGKTHILKILENHYRNNNAKAICYIDIRLLGSSPQYTDESLSIAYKCSSLFIDLLNEIYDILLNHIVYNPNKNSEEALAALNQFSDTSIELIKKTKKIIQRGKSAISENSDVNLSLNPKNIIDFNLGFKEKKDKENETIEEYNLEDSEKIVFPNIHYFLQKALDFADTELLLILDEWSTFPLQLQPYIAEFIKKSFLPLKKITVKISALEYRSNFTLSKEQHNYIGFELGSDISCNLDIDDYYVFDRNPDDISNKFSEILYKHLSTELKNDDYLKIKFSINNHNDLIKKLFTEKKTFRELVRASEGVIRDFINIFSLAFFVSQHQDSHKIGIKVIIEASRQWFERDKAKNLDEKLNEKLRKIVDDVIGSKKARSFLISRDLEKHDTIQRLFDARVIHFIKRGYSDKDNPGIRYNIYSLDYGTYVDLINTSKQLEFDFEVKENINDIEFIVPFDDKRSIRRIILTKDFLE